MIIRNAYENLQVTIPSCVHTLAGFREWAVSERFPDRGHISFIQGEILIDMSPEKVESHNQVKAEIDGVIGPLVKSLDNGKYYPDGLWITNDVADLSTEPDGTFICWETLESGRASIVAKQDGGQDGIEMRGSPDWVMEIVSDTSVEKDTVILPVGYHRAGVLEYWLIDARSDELQFTIFHRHQDRFEPADMENDWRESRVFDRNFRLTRERDRLGGWRYTLEMASGH